MAPAFIKAGVEGNSISKHHDRMIIGTLDSSRRKSIWKQKAAGNKRSNTQKPIQKHVVANETELLKKKRRCVRPSRTHKVHASRSNKYLIGKNNRGIIKRALAVGLGPA
jgi:hypothetical protein